MKYFSTNHGCVLEQIHRQYGAVKCQKKFDYFCRVNSVEALRQVNHAQISYATLYVLREAVNKQFWQHRLNQKHTLAYLLTHQICNQDHVYHRVNYLGSKKNVVQKVLHFMLSTGYPPYDMDDTYHHILDTVVSVLLHTYEDQSILPMVATLIFERAKRKQNIHTLVWAFFCCKQPESLKFIAKYLCSEDETQVALSCKLLGICPVEGEENLFMARQRQYRRYCDWIQDHKSCLCFGEQTWQQCSDPKLCFPKMENAEQLPDFFAIGDTVDPALDTEKMEEQS